MDPPKAATSDNEGRDCHDCDNRRATLPVSARLPINRCNVPPVILGALAFQRFPTPVDLDGVAELHADLFARLDTIDGKAVRAEAFRDYVTVHFCLADLEKAGFDAAARHRGKAVWDRLLRGWSVNSDGREGAVLKGWVESRFGLLARFHGEPLRDFSGAAYQRYLEMRSNGLRGTNALESQIDLVYAYSQYEFRRAGLSCKHLELFRGVNRLDEHEVLTRNGRRRVVLLNNLTSFTASRERADEFGDHILATRIPTEKVFFSHDLVPGVLKGEDEHIVIGGLYDVAF
jgi:NAD+--dinitrogen-reductase ADP-D-ribosyltransferase